MRIPAARPLYALRVPSARVHAPGPHRVAGKDTQHRLRRCREVEVEFRRLKIVDARLGRTRRNPLGLPFPSAATPGHLAVQLVAREHGFGIGSLSLDPDLPAIHGDFANRTVYDRACQLGSVEL